MARGPLQSEFSEEEVASGEASLSSSQNRLGKGNFYFWYHLSHIKE